jgi:FkbM family methyltransferase
MSLHAHLHRYFRVLPQWRFSPPAVQAPRALQHFGSAYGGYYLDPSLLKASSVVYSLGVGEDISFDLALIERFRIQVHAFDPTPRVAEWLAQQAHPAEFRFHAVGIAAHDGKQPFHLPPREDWVSHSVQSAAQYSAQTISLPVIRLSTAMRRLGHQQLDVLKMDIEGAEYGVIEEIAAEDIPVKQLVVEFHHRLSTVGVAQTRRALALLAGLGMKICHVCPRSEVFTLVRDF